MMLKSHLSAGQAKPSSAKLHSVAKRCDKSLQPHQLASQFSLNLSLRTASIRGTVPQKPIVQTRVAEPSSDAAPAPAAAAKKAWTPRVKREVAVDLATVNQGDEFEGVVTNISTFGAFVNFGASKEGLVHISQLSNKRVASVESVVKVGDTVKVRVLSLDAATGKIALTMKAEAASDSRYRSNDEEEEEEEEEDVDEPILSFAEEDDLEPEDGHEFVFADTVADFDFPFQMTEDDAELTVAAVNEFEDNEEELELETEVDIPVPLNELVIGTVERVEDYGAFISFLYNGNQFRGFLERDEAKIPASALSAEELAEFIFDGITPEYIDADFDDMKQYYKPGDLVHAFILEHNERGEINLTQFTDVEVEDDGLDIEENDGYDEDGPISDQPLSLLASTTGIAGVDVLVYDPEDLLDEEVAGDSSANADGPSGALGSASDDAVNDYKVYGQGPVGASLFTRAGVFVPSVNFPDRPLSKVDGFNLNTIKIVDRDFDGDEIHLEDLWQDTIPVPKDILKRLNLKMQIDEKGNPEIVEREGGEIAFDEDVRVSLSGDHQKRVASFVQDLMEEDEDEAELPAFAMRRPLVLAATAETISPADVKNLRNITGAGMMDCKKALIENNGDADKAVEWLRQKGLSGADKKAGRIAAEGAIATYIHPGSRLGVLVEVNCETDFVAASDKFQSLVGELGMIIAAAPDVQVVSPDEVSPEYLAKEREVELGKEDIKSKPEAVRAKIVEGRIEKMRNSVALVNQASLRDPNKTVAEIVKETTAAVGEKVSIRRFVKFHLGEGIQKKTNDFAAEVAQQTQAKADAPKKAPEAPKPADEPAKPTVQVSATVVKELRDKTGAGMMDCKKALGENNNNIELAVEWLRKKGLSGADKKAGRIAAEGAVVSYIHPGSRLGVMLEINCETDFVAASDGFNALASGLAMQIAASPGVLYVTADEIPAEVFEREKEIEMGREDLKSKPEAIRAKIAEGRVQKLAQEMCLLPQPYLMDQSKTVEQAIKEAIATIGEKISLRRFVKFQLGEGIEKKSNDFAKDIAAMTSKA